MTETATRLRDELSQLSVDERAEMAFLLIESLDADTETEVEASWDTELARRVQEVRSGNTPGVPSKSVFEQVRGKLS